MRQTMKCAGRGLKADELSNAGTRKVDAVVRIIGGLESRVAEEGPRGTTNSVIYHPNFLGGTTIVIYGVSYHFRCYHVIT